jgi:hypothetical protein
VTYSYKPKLLRPWRLGGLQFEASPGKKPNKTPPQKILKKKKKKKKAGRNVVLCNPSCVGSISRQIRVQGPPRQKHENLSQKEPKQKGLGAWFEC